MCTRRSPLLYLPLSPLFTMALDAVCPYMAQIHHVAAIRQPPTLYMASPHPVATLAVVSSPLALPSPNSPAPDDPHHHGLCRAHGHHRPTP